MYAISEHGHACMYLVHVCEHVSSEESFHTTDTPTSDIISRGETQKTEHRRLLFKRALGARRLEECACRLMNTLRDGHVFSSESWEGRPRPATEIASATPGSMEGRLLGHGTPET